MDMPEAYDDQELFRRLCRGEKDAFDDIYNAYWQKLFLYVVKVIRDKEAAEDIVQEIFISLWSRREEIADQRTLSGYLFTAARFKGINFVQDQLKKGKHEENLISYFNSKQQHSATDVIEAKELDSLINIELEKLPSKMRQVFMLSRREQLSHKEISDRLQISDKTVKKQISNVLKHFRTVLKYDSVFKVCIIFYSIMF